MTLEDLEMDNTAKIKDIKEDKQVVRRRMLDLGIIPGTCITPVLKSSSGSPRAYEVRGSLIAIRTEEAKKIDLEV